MKASSLIEGVCEADAAGKGEVRQNLARIVVELVFSAASGGRTRERVNPGPAHVVEACQPDSLALNPKPGRFGSGGVQFRKRLESLGTQRSQYPLIHRDP